MALITLPAPIAAFAVSEHLVKTAKSHPKSCTCSTCTAVIDAASEHQYDCKCGVCEFWWSRMPPEDEGDE